ncbi:MAG: hypothetical protein R3F53_08045 [Gammaproteobacteria bacterium]
MPVPLDLPAWQQLREHAEDTAEGHLRDWFKAEPDRFQRFSRRFEGLLLDFTPEPDSDENPGSVAGAGATGASAGKY